MIDASGSLAEIAGNIFGNGTLLIGHSTNLQIDSQVESGQTVAFAADNGTLSIEFPAGFAGTIDPFQAGDVIALPGATSGTIAGDVLTVYDGNLQVGTLAFRLPPTDLSLTNGSISIPVSEYVEGAAAETYSWTGTLGPDFGTPGNWNDVSDDGNLAVHAPGSLDTAEFFSSGGTISGTGTVLDLLVEPLYRATNADWIVNGTLDATNLLAIGQAAESTTMTVANGGLLASQGFVNVGNNGYTSLAILAGSTLQASGSMDIGDFASSTGLLQASPLDADATGTVSVSGNGAELDAVGSLVVGGPVAGTLIVANGGEAVAGNLLVGRYGIVNLIGGVLSASIGGFGSPSTNLSSEGTIDNAGTIALSGGTQILNALGTVTNTGVIMATGSAVATYGSDQEINNSVFGSGGTLAIGNEGDLQLNDAVGSGQIVEFLSTGTGTLTLVDPGAFAGTISGFQAGDVIDALGATSGTVIGNVVTLFSGSSQLGTLTFANAVTDITVTGSTSEALIAVGNGSPTTSADVSVSTISGGLQYVSTTQNDVIRTEAGENNLVFLGAGDDTVYSAGTDTLIGAAGAATINATGNAVAFASSALNFINGSGTSILVLGGAGSVTGGSGTVQVYGGSGTLFATGGTAGDNVLVAGSGNATLTGGGRGNIFVGGASGSSDVVTTTGSISAVFAGAASMTVSDSSGLQYFIGGSGADTVNQSGGSEGVILGSGNVVLTEVAGCGTDIIALFSGSAGGSVTVNGFTVGKDILYLGGYGSTAIVSAIAGATVNSAGTSFTFSDGSKITLSGISNAGNNVFYPSGS